MADELAVGPFQRRVQIGARRRHASAVTCRNLVETDPFLVRRIEIGVVRKTLLSSRLDETMAQRMVIPTDVIDVERSVVAAEFAAAIGIGLRLAEVRQYVLPAPTRVAEVAPVVVILLLAADIDHRVDRTRSADYFAPRPVAAPIIDAGVGFGGVFPVDALVVEGLAIADRCLDPETPIAAARLEYQHAVPAVGAESIGENAAGRACANDDVVEFGFHDSADRGESRDYNRSDRGVKHN